jgi:hypothetical protein
MSDKVINKTLKLIIVLIIGAFSIGIGMFANIVYWPFSLIYLLPYIFLSLVSGIVIGLWIHATTREKLIWALFTIIIDIPITFIVGASIWENLVGIKYMF